MSGLLSERICVIPASKAAKVLFAGSSDVKLVGCTWMEQTALAADQTLCASCSHVRLLLCRGPDNQLRGGRSAE